MLYACVNWQLLLQDDLAAVNALSRAIDIADSQKVANSLVRVFEFFHKTPILLTGAITKEVLATGIGLVFTR